MRPLTVFALALVALGSFACADRPAPALTNDPWQLPEDPVATAKAREALERIDAQLKAAAQLPPKERLAAQTRLGDDLAAAAAVADGTKLANRAYWLLAEWRIHFNHGKGAEEALNKLDACKDSGLKQLGRTLRVELLLREGRLVQAKALAERLAEEQPDFAGIRAVVALYESVGKPAPRIDGLDAAGVVIPVDATALARPYVVVFVERLNPDSQFFLQRYQAALGSRGQLVALVSDTGPAQLMEAAALLPGVLILRGGSEERLAAWRTGWGLIGDQCVVAVDGAGTIVAVQTAPADLATLPAFNAAPR
jgi:hypothetical protein